MICWANASEECVPEDDPGQTQILYTDTEFDFDTFGNQTTMVAYDDYGNASTFWQGNAITTTTTYDSNIETFPIQIINPLTHTISMAYDYALAVPTVITDANGNVSTAAYDGFGRIISVCRVLDDCTTDPTTKLEYFDTGSPFMYSRATQKVDGETDMVVEKYYNGIGQLVQTQILNTSLEDGACIDETPDGNPDVCDVIIHIDYDDTGRVAKQGLPDAVDATVSGYATPTWTGENSLDYTYTTFDDIGRQLVQKDAADGSVITYTYGLLTSTVSNARNFGTSSQTNVWGQVITVTQAEGPWMRLAYDASGRITETYKIEENKTFGSGDYTTVSMTYDFAGRLIEQDDPDLGIWTYAYDARGQMTSQTDARDCTLNFTYDILGRPITKSASEGPSGDCGTIGGTIDWYYDDYLDTPFFDNYGGSTNNAIGRRTGMDDDSGFSIWSFDERGWPITETKKIDGYANAFVTDWGYNNGGQAITMTYPSGEVVTMSYLTQGAPYDVVGDSDYLRSSTYDVNGRVVERLLGDSNLLTLDYSYWGWDESSGPGALKQLQVTKTSGGTVLQDMFYGTYSTSTPGYDPNGNITRIENRLDTGDVEVQTFTYDDIDRLFTAEAEDGGKNPYELEIYMYDSSGRYTGISSVVTYTYGTVPFHGVSSTTDGNDYAYDENGTMTNRDVSEGDFDFSYDRDNRLIDVDKDTSDHFSFVYDGDGNRVKAIDDVTGDETYYIGNYFEVTVDGSAPVGDYCAAPASSIPNNSSTGTSDTITISGTSGDITDLNVYVEIDHTAVGEIYVELEHEDTSTIVTLIDRPGAPPGQSACQGNDIDATLDDEATDEVEDECAAGTPTINGSFDPESALTAFDDPESLNGDWTLTVKDLRGGGNTGTFQSWCLDASGPTASLDGEIVVQEQPKEEPTDAPAMSILVQAAQMFARAWNRNVSLQTVAGNALLNIRRLIFLATDTPPSGETWKSYYYAGRQRVAMRVHDDANDDTYFTFSDHLGSTSVTVDDTGANYSEQRYDPWGSVRYESATESPTDLSFTGQRSNSYIKLIHMGARWYDPGLGRFISADTIVPGAYNPAAWDRFAYVLNNPLNLVDPSGHRSCTADEAATGDETCQANYDIEDMARYLEETYNWNIAGDDWTVDDLVLLTEVARDISDFIEEVSDQDGSEWISDHLETNFHQIVGPRSYAIGNHVMFNPSGMTRQFVAHELGHVFDNNHRYVSGLCNATFCGDGPGTALLNSLGGTAGFFPLIDSGPATLAAKYRFRSSVNFDSSTGCQFAGGNVGSIFGKDAVLVFGNHVVCVFTRDVG